MQISPVELQGIKAITVQEVKLPPMGQASVAPIHTMCGDEEGNLYLSDELHHSIIAMDAGGEMRWVRAGRGSEALQFRYPRGLACGVLLHGNQKQRCIAVADGWNRRVQFLDPEGRSLETWCKFEDIPFGEVCDIRFLPVGQTGAEADCHSGIWLILDRGNQRLYLFSMEGESLRQIGRRLIPAISRRWTLPGSFVAQAAHGSPYLAEFAPIDYLHYPARLVGDSESTLYVWEPYSRNLKKILCGQLLPVPRFPEKLSEWISASETGLLGWDQENGCLLYCSVEGKLRAEIPVPGVPVASNLPFGEVWIQAQDRLQRMVLAVDEDSPVEEQGGNQAGSTAGACLHVRICGDVDGDYVTRRLFRESEAVIELADEILRLTWPDAPRQPDYGSYLARLTALALKFSGLWRQFREVIHPWSVAILGRELASAAGNGSEGGKNGETEAVLRWRQLAERLQCRRNRLLLRSDALSSVLNPTPGMFGEGTMPDGLRHLLEQARSRVNDVLHMQYGFSTDHSPSDVILPIAPAARVAWPEASPQNQLPACLTAPVAVRLVPVRVLDSGCPHPSCAAFTDDGNLWVIDRSEKALYRIRAGKRNRLGAEELCDPVDLTSVGTGVVVADRPARRIWHIRNDGSFIRAFELPGGEVTALDCAGGGEPLYVAVHDPQSRRGRILILSREWRIIGEISQVGTEDLGMPAGLAVLPGGNLAVAEWRDKARVCIVSPDGIELCTLASRPPLPQEWSRPRGVCAGPDGSVLVSDDRYGCVRWFDSQLQERLIFGKGILTAPQGITFRTNKIVVADADKGDILEFDLTEMNRSKYQEGSNESPAASHAQHGNADTTLAG